MPSLKQIVENQDTHLGKSFDLFIQAAILVALVVFSLETLPNISEKTHWWLHAIEVVIVIIFTLEYLLRIYVADDKPKFIFSFFGIIDLLAIIPFYFALGVDLKLLRTLRFFKIIRSLKLFRYIKAADRLVQAVALAREEIILFFFMAILMLFFAATGIYYFEHEAQPVKFASIFHCLWWAVATLTTVGYGDMYPITVGGRIFTFVILMVGLSIIAVPTGLLASAMFEVREKKRMEEEKTHLERGDEQSSF